MSEFDHTGAHARKILITFVVFQEVYHSFQITYCKAQLVEQINRQKLHQYFETEDIRSVMISLNKTLVGTSNPPGFISSHCTLNERFVTSQIDIKAETFLYSDNRRECKSSSQDLKIFGIYLI